LSALISSMSAGMRIDQHHYPGSKRVAGRAQRHVVEWKGRRPRLADRQAAISGEGPRPVERLEGRTAVYQPSSDSE